jgi:hypothetical protein
MSYIYNTHLKCKSNRKLLLEIDPDEIIKDRNSEFVSSKKGAYNYITRNGTMHSSIVTLSSDYPTEVFIAQYYCLESGDAVIETYKYLNGFSKCIKTEPYYMYCLGRLERKMGKKTVKKFMKVVLKQFKKIDSIEEGHSKINEGEPGEHSINSSITISVEDKDFKIEAYRVGRSFIEVNGYTKTKKDSIPKWQVIEKEKNKVVKVSHKMEEGAHKTKRDEYEPLPF